jgi:hypothetical protein
MENLSSILASCKCNPFTIHSCAKNQSLMPPTGGPMEDAFCLLDSKAVLWSVRLGGVGVWAGGVGKSVKVDMSLLPVARAAIVACMA